MNGIGLQMQVISYNYCLWCYYCFTSVTFATHAHHIDPSKYSLLIWDLTLAQDRENR